MTPIQHLVEQLAGALDRIATLETRAAASQLRGPVVERDHEKGVRLRLGGSDEEPFLSPWVQPPDIPGVSRYLPQVGEQYEFHAANGDPQQATISPLTHSDQKKNPAQHADEVVLFNQGKIRLSIDTKAGSMTFVNDKSKTTWNGFSIVEEVDGHTRTTTKEGTTFKDGKLKHDDHNIGKDHIHGGVKSGGEKTAAPEA